MQRTPRIPVEKADNDTILAWLDDDGYEVPDDLDTADRLAETIRQAAAQGALLWTPQRLTVTLAGAHLDMTPDR